MSQLMRLRYLSHRRPAKAQASLRICAVSPEPSLFAHMKYGSRRRVLPKNRHLAPLEWLHMRVWRMRLRTTKSSIILWVVSYNVELFMKWNFQAWVILLKLKCLHFYCNRLRWKWHSCCSSFLNEKHLPYQSCDLYHAFRWSNVSVSQLCYLFTNVWVTLVRYRHDIKHGSSTSWWFQILC